MLSWSSTSAGRSRLDGIGTTPVPSNTVEKSRLPGCMRAKFRPLPVSPIGTQPPKSVLRDKLSSDGLISSEIELPVGVGVSPLLSHSLIFSWDLRIHRSRI